MSRPLAAGIPNTGNSIGDATGDVSGMLATGGMKSVTDEGNEDEKDGYRCLWQQWQWQPWKKTRFESYSGHWQKSSSWQGSWQPAEVRKRQYHKQQCHRLASGSYDGSSSMKSVGTRESLLAPGSMRLQLTDALSRWPAFPSSSSSLMKEGGLEDSEEFAAKSAQLAVEGPHRQAGLWRRWVPGEGEQGLLNQGLLSHAYLSCRTRCKKL